MRAPKRDCLGLEECSFEQPSFRYLSCTNSQNCWGKKSMKSCAILTVLTARNFFCRDCRPWTQGTGGTGAPQPAKYRVPSEGRGETTESRKRATSPICPARIPEIIVSSYHVIPIPSTVPPRECLLQCHGQRLKRLMHLSQHVTGCHR